jgi:GT2 family glycosyltransferase
VLWPLPENDPLVSIVIPTRDKVELLRACVESILAHTAYRNFEIIIVDNRSIEAETAVYLAQIASNDRITILTHDEEYNYSAINNRAVAVCGGEFICLLNNDTEIISEGWLGTLLRHASCEHVGAVGAKLLYGDGSIQHAGVVMGLGGAAGHAHRGLPNDQPGYFGQPHVARGASAVTAACLLVGRAKFNAIGGLDEHNLMIAFNDVDMCLKLNMAGWRTIYAPQATLFHHESRSRGQDLAPEHIDRYMRELAVLQGRWRTQEFVDPMHHPGLDRTGEQYQLGFLNLPAFDAR